MNEHPVNADLPDDTASTIAAGVGAAITLAREAAGMTITELAGLAGVTRPNLSNIEAGKRGMLVDTLVKVAVALGIPAGALLGEVLVAPAEHAVAVARKVAKAKSTSFTVQPYPLFLTSLDRDATVAEDIMVGRVIGWDTTTYPKPVVVFESDGFDFPPIVVNTLADKSETWPPKAKPTKVKLTWAGPMWIRDTRDEAVVAAKAYLDGRHH